MLKALKQSVLSIGKKIDGPTFVKPFEDQSDTIRGLEEIANQIGDKKLISSIKRDITFIKAGDHGEKNVEFELKNSFIPMLCLHNVMLEHNGLTAQMDYVIITNKFICILETKKLNGDVEIRNNGDFVRTFKSNSGKAFKKEGMYSPITQNERHVKILHEILIKNELIKYTPIHSLVVMANPKNIINHKYAPKYMKEQIVKADQLKNKLEALLKVKSDVNLPVLRMYEIAEFIKDHAIQPKNTFLKKYEDDHDQVLIEEKATDRLNEVDSEDRGMSEEVNKEVNKNEAIKGAVGLEETNETEEEILEVTEDIDLAVETNKKTREELVESLKKYRLETSRAEEVKAYYIFSNAQMEELIDKYPKSRDELLSIKGFGQVKVEKYGDAILGIFE